MHDSDPMAENNTSRRLRLARNVRDARRRAGTTGGQLALSMRKRGHLWDAAQVSRIETAGRPITAEALGDLAEILKTTADELLNGGADDGRA